MSHLAMGDPGPIDLARRTAALASARAEEDRRRSRPQLPDLAVPLD